MMSNDSDNDNDNSNDKNDDHNKVIQHQDTNRDGSGLASFFSEFLPPSHKAKRRQPLINNTSNNDDDDVNENHLYSTSLVDLKKVESKEYEDIGSTPQTAVGVTFINDGEYNFKRWRDLLKDTLTEYILKRMASNNNKSSSGNDDDHDDDDDDENYDDIDDEGCNEDDVEPSDEEQDDEDDIHNDAFRETQPETQIETQPDMQPETQPETPQPQTRLETQPQSPPQFETQEEPHHLASLHKDVGGNDDVSTRRCHRKKRKRQERKRIPHVNETIHEVSKIEYLDLYTQILNLPLCRVVKVWGVRETKRAARYPLFRTKSLPRIAGRLPRFPLGYNEEDGPLSSIFKQVLSMEVVQFKFDPTRPVEISHHHQQQLLVPRMMRLRIFFYDDYATSINQWIAKHRRVDNQNKTNTHRKQQPEFVIRLANIPAKCILPFAIDSRNWMDQTDLIEYCLCIGNTSRLKRTSKDGTLHPMRFDTDNMDVSILATTTTDNKTDKNNDTTVVGRPTSIELDDIWSIRKHFPTKGSSTDGESSPDDNVVGDPLQQAWSMFSEAQQKAQDEEFAALVGPPVQHAVPLVPQQEEENNIVNPDQQQRHDVVNPNPTVGGIRTRPPNFLHTTTTTAEHQSDRPPQQDTLPGGLTNQNQTILTDEPIVPGPLTVVGGAIRKTVPRRLERYVKLVSALSDGLIARLFPFEHHISLAT
jgi:hypothetical protein